MKRSQNVQRDATCTDMLLDLICKIIVKSYKIQIQLFESISDIMAASFVMEQRGDQSHMTMKVFVSHYI